MQFVRAAESDTAGTLVGFPTAGFNWNDFTYYSTYVTFHGASAGSDVIYVRDEAGNPLYSWTDPNLIGTSETIVGTPQWTTSGSTHYLYVAVNGAASNTGGIYRLKDTGTKTTSGTLTLDTAWPTTGTTAGTGHYNCTCTISSHATLDTSNLYWAATNASGQRLYGITQSGGPRSAWRWPVTAPANVTTSAPTLVTSSGALYLGATSTLAQLNFSTLAWMQDVPAGIGTITGRVSYGTSFLPATNGTSRIYIGDASGEVWAISPSAFSSSGTVTTFLWKYAAGSAVTDNYYDAGTDTRPVRNLGWPGRRADGRREREQRRGAQLAAIPTRSPTPTRSPPRRSTTTAFWSLRARRETSTSWIATPGRPSRRTA